MVDSQLKIIVIFIRFDCVVTIISSTITIQYDQRGGYKLLYYTRHYVVQTKVLISLESDLHITV